MFSRPILISALMSFFFATNAQSADFSDPTWPCIQRKVEKLSVGIMWPHPFQEVEIDAEARDLGLKLALRRISLDESEALIAAYMADHPDTSLDTLSTIFKTAFDRIGRDRGAIINGIGDYAQKQTALSEKIDDVRVEMSELMKAESPDFDRVDALEEQLDWDERIYRDRAQSLTYVCETPVLLEKRIYAIGQLLAKHVP